jgi:hypothetical protein
MSVMLTKRFAFPGHGLAKYTVTRFGMSGAILAAQADILANVDDGTLVIAVPSANEVDLFAGEGFLEEPSHGLGSPGDRLYLSQSVAGAITTTEPGGGILRELGYVIDENSFFWLPKPAFEILS